MNKTVVELIKCSVIFFILNFSVYPLQAENTFCISDSNNIHNCGSEENFLILNHAKVVPDPGIASRRNIFFDIKKSKDLIDPTQKRIVHAQKLISLKKAKYCYIPPPRPLLDDANRYIEIAIDAFNNKNYFKARHFAELAIERAEQVGPKFCVPAIDIYYVDYKIVSRKKTATLVIINHQTDTCKKISVRKGDKFSETLPQNTGWKIFVNSANKTDFAEVTQIKTFLISEINSDTIKIYINNNIWSSQDHLQTEGKVSIEDISEQY